MPTFIGFGPTITIGGMTVPFKGTIRMASDKLTPTEVLTLCQNADEVFGFIHRVAISSVFHTPETLAAQALLAKIRPEPEKLKTPEWRWVYPGVGTTPSGLSAIDDFAKFLGTRLNHHNGMTGNIPNTTFRLWDRPETFWIGYSREGQSWTIQVSEA